MARRIATVSWSSAGVGLVLALVHPGGLLAGPITIHRISIEARQHLELRVEYHRYATKATGGTQGTSSSVADGVGAGSAEVRFGAVQGLGTPTLVIPDRLATRGVPVGGHVFASGDFTLTANHTFGVALLDAAPSSADWPIAFVLEFEE